MRAMLAVPWPHEPQAQRAQRMGLGLIRRLIKGKVPIYDRLLGGRGGGERGSRAIIGPITPS